jgi:murein DD-endopeptidase MepM/ murein hydrolase activator NlpD
VRARTTLVSVLSAAALLGGLLVPAHADDDLWDKKDQVDEQVAAAQDDLEASSRRLREAASALADSRSQLPAARAALADARGRMETARDQLQIIRARLRELRAEQAIVQSEIDAALARIALTEETMGDIVRFQYQSHGLTELQVVLSADDASDFLQKMLTTQQVLDEQSDVVDQLIADKAVLTAREQQMEVTEDSIQVAEDEALQTFQRLKDLTLEARAAQRRIEALVQQREQALRVAREERAAERARLERLKDAQEALAAQIQQQTSSSGGGFPDGELIWPTNGALGGGVGWRVHPVYGYQSCHTGIDISAGYGTPIVAARRGVVIWTRSELSAPYGNNTLIDHGNGLSTFYAHQSSFNVSPGTTVDAGDVIGYVGSTGYSTGAHLHFEVHVDGVPYDPMGWFGGSKTPQSQFCP